MDQSNTLWSGRLRAGFRNNNFHLVAQRIQPTNPSDRLQYFEFFLRYRDNQGDAVPAQKFLPEISQSATLLEIDRWVVAQVLEFRKTVNVSNLRVGINLAASSLCDPSFYEFLLEKLLQDDPGDYCIELKSEDAFRRSNELIPALDRLRSVGARIALDNFCGGYQAYEHFRSLSIDYIKFDSRHVAQGSSEDVGYASAEVLNRFGQMFGLCTIAIGIEDQETIDYIKQISVDYAQGYFVHLPVELDVLATTLAQQ